MCWCSVGEMGRFRTDRLHSKCQFLRGATCGDIHVCDMTKTELSIDAPKTCLPTRRDPAQATTKILGPLGGTAKVPGPHRAQDKYTDAARPSECHHAPAAGSARARAILGPTDSTVFRLSARRKRRAVLLVHSVRTVLGDVPHLWHVRFVNRQSTHTVKTAGGIFLARVIQEGTE